MKLDKWIESVPNFSEGRDLKKVERIVDSFRAKPGVEAAGLLHRPRPQPLRGDGAGPAGAPEAGHGGGHRHGGGADRYDPGTRGSIPHRLRGRDPLHPGAGLHHSGGGPAGPGDSTGSRSGSTGQPFYLYEKSATAPHRVDLANIRKGQFEGLAEKMKDPLWKPDFGPDTIHPTGRATAIGARMPLICFNINLDTPNVEIARQIARRVRNIGGGLHYVKAMGIALEERNLAQVTMNLTDYTKSSIYSVFEMVKMEARRYGVRVVGSEVVGIVPMKALLDCAEYYLQIEDFSSEQVLELHIE